MKILCTFCDTPYFVYFYVTIPSEDKCLNFNWHNALSKFTKKMSIKITTRKNTGLFIPTEFYLSNNGKGLPFYISVQNCRLDVVCISS